MFVSFYLLVFVFVLTNATTLSNTLDEQDEALIPQEKREADGISEFRDYIRQVGNQFEDDDIRSTGNPKEPIPLQDFNISLTFPEGTIFGKLTNLQLHSVEGSKLDKVTINLSKRVIFAAVSIKLLGIKGQYIFDSDISLKQLSRYAQGAFWMNMSSIPFRGHSQLQITSDDKLKVGHFNISSGLQDDQCIDIKVLLRNINFENLTTIGDYTGTSKEPWRRLHKRTVISEIERQIQTPLLSAIGSYVQDQLNNFLLKLPSRYIDPVNMNVIEYILNNLAESMAANDMEPLHLPESRPARLSEINGKFFNVTVDGSSTFSRKEDIVVNVYDNFIVLGACFEFKNLTATSMWEVEIRGKSKRGQVMMEMTSVSAFFRLQQRMEPGSKLELDYLIFEDVCHNWLDSESFKKLKNKQEDIKSKLSSSLANYIITEWYRVVNKRILEQLDKLSIQLPDENTALMRYFYYLFYGKKPQKTCP